MFHFERKNIHGLTAADNSQIAVDIIDETSVGAVFTDREIFIRNTFDQDPAIGCKLLFKRYFVVLCSHALRFVYSKQIAEDIVSEVFCRFWERKSYRQVAVSYRAYLFTAVRNAALNQLKKEFGKNISPIDQFEEHFLEQGNLSLDLQADELNQLIEKTIRTLPPRCQTVFLMSRLEGKKNADIAVELNISIKAIEAHMTRALDKLRKALKDEYLN